VKPPSLPPVLVPPSASSAARSSSVSSTSRARAAGRRRTRSRRRRPPAPRAGTARRPRGRRPLPGRAARRCCRRPTPSSSPRRRRVHGIGLRLVPGTRRPRRSTPRAGSRSPRQVTLGDRLVVVLEAQPPVPTADRPAPATQAHPTHLRSSAPAPLLSINTPNAGCFWCGVGGVAVPLRPRLRTPQLCSPGPYTTQTKSAHAPPTPPKPSALLGHPRIVI
jgi:hypothetical protein